MKKKLSRNKIKLKIKIKRRKINMVKINHNEFNK